MTIRPKRSTLWLVEDKNAGMFYGSFSAPQWCGGCGRKLGADGRCGGCDTWWSSPLVTVGGPLVGATLFFLAVTIAVFRAGDPAPPRAQPVASAILSAPRVESTPGPIAYLPLPGMPSPFAPPRYAPVRIMPPPPPVPVVAALPAPSQEEIQLERLRGMLSHADSVVAAQEAARLGLTQSPPFRSGVSAGGTGFVASPTATAAVAWF